MSNQTRRTFLVNSSMTMAAGSALLCAPSMRAFAQSSVARSWTGGRFALELDGAVAGFIVSAAGGEMNAARPAPTPSVGGMIGKAPPMVSWTPLSLTCDTGMSAAFYQWLQQSLTQASPTKSGALLTCNFDYKGITRLDWTSGRIIQVQFPPLVAGAGGAYQFLVVIGADSFNHGKYGGTCLPPGYPRARAAWTTGTFSLGAAGYPGLGLVTSISAINISLNTPTRGGSFTFQIHPQQTQQVFPNAAAGIQPQLLPPNLAMASRTLIPPLQLSMGLSQNQSYLTLTFLQPLLTRISALPLPGQPTQFQVDFADVTIALSPALIT